MFGKAKAWIDRKQDERAERKFLESPVGRARTAWEAGEETFTFSDRTGKSDVTNHYYGLDEPHVVIPTDPELMASVASEGWEHVETTTHWVRAVFSDVNVAGYEEEPRYEQRQVASGYHQHRHAFRRLETRSGGPAS